MLIFSWSFIFDNNILRADRSFFSDQISLKNKNFIFYFMVKLLLYAGIAQR